MLWRGNQLIFHIGSIFSTATCETSNEKLNLSKIFNIRRIISFALSRYSFKGPGISALQGLPMFANGALQGVAGAIKHLA